MSKLTRIVCPTARNRVVTSLEKVAVRENVPLSIMTSGESPYRWASGSFVMDCTGFTHTGLDLPKLPGGFTSDVAVKRDIGLTFTNSHDIVLLADDDITGITRQHLHHALTLLKSGYSIVAFEVSDFPDNSVVRHAARLSGMATSVRPSGGAMVLLPHVVRSWHPPGVYNEDWFFLHRELRAGRVARGMRVKQHRYDPYQPGRAMREEAGDVIAEAVNAVSDPRTVNWRVALDERRELISSIVKRTTNARVLASLTEAESVRRLLTPELLGAWVDAWQSSHLAGFTQERTKVPIRELHEEPMVTHEITMIAVGKRDRFD